MRNFYICASLLLVLSGFGYGGNTTRQTLPGVAEPESTTPWNGILHTDGSGAPWSAENRDPDRDQVCYKMRSYLVRRESRRSDAVEGIGYRTCLPGTRVEMRTTELPESPARR
jgi:hypothetical protein